MKASTDIIGEAFKKMHDQQSRRDNVMRELERKEQLQKAAIVIAMNPESNFNLSDE